MSRGSHTAVLAGRRTWSCRASASLRTNSRRPHGLNEVQDPEHPVADHGGGLEPCSVRGLTASGTTAPSQSRQAMPERVQVAPVHRSQLPDHLVGPLTLPLHRELLGYFVPQRLSLRLDQDLQGRSPVDQVQCQARLAHPVGELGRADGRCTSQYRAHDKHRKKRIRTGKSLQPCYLSISC